MMRSISRLPVVLCPPPGLASSQPLPLATVIAIRWEVTLPQRTSPCHFNSSVSARQGCGLEVNFTLDFLRLWQFRMCSGHLDPPPRLSHRHLPPRG